MLVSSPRQGIKIGKNDKKLNKMLG